MMGLRESLINKSNIKNFKKSYKPIIKKLDKNDLETGDLVVLKDKTPGIVVLKKDEVGRCLSGLVDSTNGTILFFEDNYCWSNLNLEGYKQNLESYLAGEYDIVKVVGNLVPKEYLQDYDAFWEWLSDGENYAEYID